MMSRGYRGLQDEEVMPSSLTPAALGQMTRKDRNHSIVPTVCVRRAFL